MPNDTIFDKILAGEISTETVYQDDDVFAFKDINPQAPVHVLVIPKKRISDFTDLADADVDHAGVYLKKVARVAKILGLDKDGYRVVFNSGPYGQQSVEYLHAHILGGRQMKWPPG